MQAQPLVMELRMNTVARLTWPVAKIVHFNPVFGPATFSPGCRLSSNSEPASVSFVFSGRHDGFVLQRGITKKRTVVGGYASLCGPEPLIWLGGSGATEFIEITASSPFRRKLAEELDIGGRTDLDDIFDFFDPVIWAIAVKLRSAIRESCSLSDIERDQLLRHLYARVYIQRLGGKLRARGDGGLDRTRLNRVLEYIETQLQTELTIDDLARTAALSPFHFMRAFRRSMGISPHQYVRGRRLERARQLIRKGVAPKEVAGRTGYDSLSHFRAAYLIHFGYSSDIEIKQNRTFQ
jgi:AraC-like DNA-binding protein